MPKLALLLCLLLSGIAAAQTAEVKNVLVDVPNFQVVNGVIYVPEGTIPKVQSVGLITVPEDWPQTDESSTQIIVRDISGKKLPFVTIKPNVFQINESGKVNIILVNQKPFFFDMFELAIGPTPVPPPPGPGPGPLPPNPLGPPIPGAGLKVLISYEADEVASYASTVRSQLFSSPMRVTLNGLVGRDTANQPMIRVLDKDTTCPLGQPNMWCLALGRPRTALPWIIISNSTTGYEGPLPTTEAETIKLIERYKN